MSSKATLKREGEEVSDQLKDTIVSKIVEKGGVCATDLAGLIGTGTRPQDLLPALESLVSRGVIRVREKAKNDPREYNKFQTVYELAR